MLPAASQPTSVGRSKMYLPGLAAGRARGRRGQRVRRFRPPAQRHHHAAFGVELDDHVRAFVHGPDVVLRIDAHRVREHEAVQALADFADEGALLIEFEQARPLAARVDEDVSLGVGGDADAFAEVEVGAAASESWGPIRRESRARSALWRARPGRRVSGQAGRTGARRTTGPRKSRFGNISA